MTKYCNRIVLQSTEVTLRIYWNNIDLIETANDTQLLQNESTEKSFNVNNSIKFFFYFLI